MNMNTPSTLYYLYVTASLIFSFSAPRVKVRFDFLLGTDLHDKKEAQLVIETNQPFSTKFANANATTCSSWLESVGLTSITITTIRTTTTTMTARKMTTTITTVTSTRKSTLILTMLMRTTMNLNNFGEPLRSTNSRKCTSGTEAA